jgi:F-type H+-transporting ATPase subunit b
MLDLALLSAAAHEVAEEPTALGFGPGAWVALSMIAVILLMLKVGVPKIVAGMLDKQIGEIRKALDDAARLRTEAEALRAEYAAKIAGAEAHAAEMLDHAKAEAKAIVDKAKTDTTAVIARREKMAEEKISAAERSAVAELRNRAAATAATAAGALIADKHDAKADQSLVDAAIAGI